MCCRDCHNNARAIFHLIAIHFPIHINDGRSHDLLLCIFVNARFGRMFCSLCSIGAEHWLTYGDIDRVKRCIFINFKCLEVGACGEFMYEVNKRTV